MRKFIASCCLSAVALGGAPAAHATAEEAAFLQRVAEQYILAQFRGQADEGARISVRAARLDERRDYGGRCEGYLTAQLQGSSVRSSSTVKVMCTKPGSSFTVLIPVTVKKQVSSLVAARTMSPGEVIRREDIREIYVDENQSGSGTINSYGVLVGSRIKRELKADSPFRASLICVVCKGEKVTIEANNGSLHLRTTGLAMEDGNMHQNIRVKNSKSSKIIHGKVIGPARVDVSI